MPAVHETAYPRLKPTPTAAELERLYTPTPAEHQLAQTVTKGPVARITFLVLLKTFQRLGYFVLLKDVPERIVQHIITTTTIPLRIADLAGYDVSGTRKRHVAAIRTHMQVQPYDATARRLLIHALMIAAQTKNDVADLINIGIEELIRLRYELPAFKPLHRVARHSRAVTHRRLYTQIQLALGPMIQAQLDALLVSDPTTHDTPWNRLKQDPGTPTLTHLKLLIDHLTWIIALPNVRGALAILADVKLKYFASDANTLDAARMQALAPAKRITLLAALVVVQTARAYDDVAEMFVKRMLAIHQKAKDALAAYQVAHQAQTDKLVLTLRNLLIAFQGTGSADERIHSMGGVLPESTDDLVTACDAYLAYSGNNYYPFMWNCYRSHRPTLFRIVNILTFESTSQNTDFLAALEFLRTNEQSKGDWLPVYHDVHTEQGMRFLPIIPLSWIPEGWWRLLTDHHTTTPPPHKVRRRHFEVCVFAHLMAQLKSGDIAIVGSDAYADYRTQLIDWTEYDQTVGEYGQMLGFPIDGPAFTAHVQAQLSQQAQETDAAFPTLTAVHIENGEPVVGRTPRRPDPPGLKALEDRIAATVKPVNILDVIRYTEHWLHWMQPFGPISGHDSKLENPTARYVATVFCYGCNLGPTQTARGIAGLDRKQVAWPNQRHITEDALEEAIQIVINAYQRGGLPKHWGTGKSVSADGTKWDLYEQNLLAEYHIRYGGYGGIGYYHVSDTYIALFSHFIPCGVWEAVYILDGLLKNESEIQPDTIHADTQGQSAPVFALAYLLGIRLMPRIRNWKHLTFFRPKSTEHYTHIDDIFSDSIDWKLIETHLPDMLRVALSIKAGRITPSTILRRLSTYNQHNRLYQAFRELGRAVRTHFLLLYLRDAELRSTIHAALNKSEAFNNFVQWIAFGGEGVLASNDRAVQRKIIKYNHLVANCTIFYNAVVISQALYELHASGVVIDADALAAISPIITEHIDRFGRYPSDEALPPPFDESIFHGGWLPTPLIGQHQPAPVLAKSMNPAQQGQLGFEGLAPL